MQKSEMLTKIEHEIMNYLGNLDYAEVQILANNILARVEQAGMLPPQATNPKPDYKCLCTMREQCYSCGTGHEWEPENDKG